LWSTIGRGMAKPASSRPGVDLIADRYSVEVARPLPPVGGLAAFAAVDRTTGQTDLMAIQVHRLLPPRPRALQALSVPIDGLLTPLAYGVTTGEAGSTEEAGYVICLTPPGPSLLARPRPWPEAELLEAVLRPAARVLEQLQALGVTHRGIRLDNVFQSRPGQSVVLGTAWAAPPASGQPALFEPPYSAMCLPAGRGEGSIADDVYSLGVLLLCLGVGQAQLAQLDDAVMLRRKLELGSFAALLRNDRLSPVVSDLVRGMLAEDPEHRPAPSLLLDPASARGRRVAARPPRRAQRPMPIAGVEVWDARSLAQTMAVEPDAGVQALRSGAAVQWLRRGVGDATLAARVEDLARHRVLDARPDETHGDAVLVMRAIALLDPLAPLCWRGLIFWPNGIGAALAAAQATDAQAASAEVSARLQEVVMLELTGSWAAMRPERCDFAVLRVEARQQHAWLQLRVAGGGEARLCYLLNPLMPCASKLMGGHWVTRLAELLRALEDTAGRTDHKQVGPVDVQVAAFIAARSERRLDSEIMALAGAGPEDSTYLAQLRILAQLQTRHHPQPLPGLAAWLGARAGPLLATWRNQDRRAAITGRLQVLAQAGHLAPMLGLVDDPAVRGADAREAQLAAMEVGRIDAELAEISAGASSRASIANRLGQEIAAGVGLAALATVLAVAALS
jgi:eukaryotic-like serine/threonine-protein kinase